MVTNQLVYRMIGLYIMLLPDGTIKRHLSTENGEVPLADTTVAEELISFTGEDHLSLLKFTQELIREIKNIYETQNDYFSFCKEAYLYLVSLEKSSPLFMILSQASIADRLSEISERNSKDIALGKFITALVAPIQLYINANIFLNALCNEGRSPPPALSFLTNYRFRRALSLISLPTQRGTGFLPL